MKYPPILLLAFVASAGFVALRCGAGLDTLGGGALAGCSGASAWSSTLEDGANPGNAQAQGIALDCSGNTFIAGFTGSAIDGQTLKDSSGNDLFLAKYGPDGKRQWTVEDGPGGTGTATALGVATDANGNVYIVGNVTGSLDGKTVQDTGGAGFTDYFVVKYNAAGVHQWTIQNGPGGALSTATGVGVAVDSQANVYVTGITSAALDGQIFSGAGAIDYYIAMYNTNGVHQWTIEDGVSGLTTHTAGIALDASGDIYVTGQTNGPLDGKTLKGTLSFFLTKYNPHKQPQWTVLDGGTGNTQGSAVAIDPSGNVYATGVIQGVMDGATHVDTGFLDIFLTKYKSAGVLSWTQQDGPGTNQAISQALAVDGSGNAYVSGFTSAAMHGQTLHDSTGSDVFLSKYDLNGNRLLTIEDGPGGSIATAEAFGLAVDASGNVFLAGTAQHFPAGPTNGMDGAAASGNNDYLAIQFNAMLVHN